MTEEERQALAGEYVLGTLNAAEARAVRDNPEMTEAVAEWEARLAPLHALAQPEAPPPDLWARIDRRLTDAAPWIALASGISADFVSERVRNFQVNWQGIPMYSQIWVR